MKCVQALIPALLLCAGCDPSNLRSEAETELEAMSMHHSIRTEHVHVNTRLGMACGTAIERGDGVMTSARDREFQFVYQRGRSSWFRFRTDAEEMPGFRRAWEKCRSR